MVLEIFNKNGKYCFLSFYIYYGKGFMISINYQIQIIKYFLKIIFEFRGKKNEQMMKEKIGVYVLVYI